MTVVYVWCDCATPPFRRHYYTGEHCWLSGWIAPYVREVMEAVKAVERSGIPVTIKALVDAGRAEAAERVLVADFPDGADVPWVLGVGSYGEPPAPRLFFPKERT